MCRTTLELVRDFDGSYYANLTTNGHLVESLPEYVDFKTLKRAIKAETGITVPPLSAFKFQKCGRKSYGHLKNPRAWKTHQADKDPFALTPLTHLATANMCRQISA